MIDASFLLQQMPSRSVWLLSLCELSCGLCAQPAATAAYTLPLLCLLSLLFDACLHLQRHVCQHTLCRSGVAGCQCQQSFI